MVANRATTTGTIPQDHCPQCRGFGSSFNSGSRRDQLLAPFTTSSSPTFGAVIRRLNVEVSEREAELARINHEIEQLKARIGARMRRCPDKRVGASSGENVPVAYPTRMPTYLAMCGQIIQSSSTPRYAIVDGMNVGDTCVHNHPPRWNGAPSHSSPFGIGGVWENWKEPKNKWIRTFAIVTTDANELVADIHDRMPQDYVRWLCEEAESRDLMQPFPAERMRMWPISTRVNKPESGDASIIEPIELQTAAAA
jgi:SOS response associated peptidase (SRAP)